MGQMGGRPEPARRRRPKRVLKNTGRTETVDGIKCTVWEASEGGKKEEELCAAPPGSVPGGDEMMKTLREVGEMLQGFYAELRRRQQGRQRLARHGHHQWLADPDRAISMTRKGHF